MTSLNRKSNLIIALGCVGAGLAVAAGIAVERSLGHGVVVGYTGLMLVWTVSFLNWHPLSLVRRAGSTPEAAVRALLSLSMLHPRRAWALLVLEDRDDWVRTPPPWVAPGAIPHPRAVFDNSASFADYWRALAGANIRRTMHITSTIRASRPLAPDIALVTVDVGFRSRSPRALKAAFFLTLGGSAVAACGIAAVIHFKLFESLGPWTLIPFGAAFLISYAPAMLAMLGMLPQPLQTVTVTKLVVRAGGKWQVFNGELMGPEEADLSWLEQLGIALPPQGVTS